MSLDQTLLEIKGGIDALHGRMTTVQVDLARLDTTLSERVPEDLKETVQSLKDSQENGCDALRAHERGHKKVWYAVVITFIGALGAMFKGIFSKALGIE